MTVLKKLWTGTNRSIMVNAGSLIGTTAVTSGLGFVYWLLAARLFAPGAVGLASASISAMTLLGYLGMLGLGTMLMGELPNHRGHESRLINTAFLASGVTGLALGVVFALIAPSLITDFRPLRSSVGMVTVFALGVGLSSGTMVADQALIGLLRGSVQFGRNAVFAIVKLLALGLAAVWLYQRTGIAIYVTWIIGNLVSTAGVAVVGSVRGWFDISARPEWSALGGLRRAALGHHALNLTLQLPVLGLPIVVTATLTAAFNAYFYVAWMVAVSFIWVAPAALSVVLYAVSSNTPAALGRAIRFTVGISIVAGVLTNAVLPSIGDRILELFGGPYVAHAGASLQILALAVFPLVVKDHFVNLCRLDRRLATTAAWIAAAGGLELVGGAVGARIDGLAGLSIGWTAVICLEAIVMTPRVYRAIRLESRPSAARMLRPASADSER